MVAAAAAACKAWLWAADLFKGQRQRIGMISFILGFWIAINFLARSGNEGQLLKIIVDSINYAGLSTIICVLVGYPAAYFIGRSRESVRNLLLMAVMIPFWTSFLVRTYAWITILSDNGLLNSLLKWMDLINEPIMLKDTPTAVMIGLVYTYLPFMILPIYGSVERLDNAMVEAAFDLGAGPLRAFWGVILPLTRPGVVAGILLVFIPAIGMFAVNDMLGGRNVPMIGSEIERHAIRARNLPFGAALGTVLLVVFVIIYYLGTRRREVSLG
ncbi:MAG: ABC transporter permease [Burkholderiales bacterium]|nr:ABC transporter permease [Phycisphaerae bacterium]